MKDIGTLTAALVIGAVTEAATVAGPLGWKMRVWAWSDRCLYRVGR